MQKKEYLRYVHAKLVFNRLNSFYIIKTYFGIFSELKIRELHTVDYKVILESNCCRVRSNVLTSIFAKVIGGRQEESLALDSDLGACQPRKRSDRWYIHYTYSTVGRNIQYTSYLGAVRSNFEKRAHAIHLLLLTTHCPE